MLLYILQYYDIIHWIIHICMCIIAASELDCFEDKYEDVPTLSVSQLISWKRHFHFVLPFHVAILNCNIM